MLKKHMYVRCPADAESATDPRVFVCGQIISIDTFENTAVVQVHDPFDYFQFFETLPSEPITVPLDAIDHCTLFIGSEVMAHQHVCKILSVHETKSGFYDYYVQYTRTKTIARVCESDLIASFTNGRVDPTQQLARYELQNPCWYMGRTVVSRSMNILDNSIYGFKELAGSKIYLLPHQVNTIMRCLQEKPCRYMLADEVGMGKTIEAISVLKIFMQDRSDSKVLIVVPDALKEQWKSELLLKFNLSIGRGENGNEIYVKSIAELSTNDLRRKWTFLIVDEVHRYLDQLSSYTILHALSRDAQNVLLLSATPVQQRKQEYLSLLQLLQPKKYDHFSVENFGHLVDQQSQIIQKTALVLDDLGDYEKEFHNAVAEGKDPHESEDCQDLYEEIYDRLEEICQTLKDPSLDEMLEQIDFDKEDIGTYQIKVIISYICSNYQIESNIIRNRRKLLENSDEETHLLPTRELHSAPYCLDQDRNHYEALCYERIENWIVSNRSTLDIEAVVRPLLGSFFSSPWAFQAQLNKFQRQGIELDEELLEYAHRWLAFETNTLHELQDVMNDPDAYPDTVCSRLLTVLNLISQDLYDQKIVLFTNYTETFHLYQSAMSKVFSPEEISFFGADMEHDEIELNAYRFQNNASCRLMLCDYTGGEGRNFQCADYIVHIDLPWDASMIEQRIGRLDRLERDPARPIVHSVVVYTENSFENALFNFWNDGLKIFTHSLSGMEIIMKDINQEIISAIRDDFKFGLFERVPKIVHLTDQMRETVRKEQNFDAAGFMFRPMYTELRRLIDYYTQNENDLFAHTMTSWASLAGFHGFSSGEGVITYTASSFSPKSAINSQLIPPRWSQYMDGAQNQFVAYVEAAYQAYHLNVPNGESIRGTFLRKKAIENDYLHFFAPGDDIFDGIVNNAINSCRGQSSALAIRSNLNWRGFVFIWSLVPDESYLLQHRISSHALGPYRNYLMCEQVITPISLLNKEDHSDEEIIREFTRLINIGFIHNSSIVHLGKRSREAGFLKNVIPAANIDWFKSKYPEEKWVSKIEKAREKGLEKATAQFARRANIRGAQNEMERILSARVANCNFYGITAEKIDKLKEEQGYILQALQNPRITLDSAAFVWMVK